MKAKRKKKKLGVISLFPIFIICIFIIGLLVYNYLNSSLNNNPKESGDELQVIAIEMTGTYGDSFIIKYNDFEILVDAGTESDKKYVQEALVEFVEDKEIDILMLSHLHADHIGAMTSTSFFSDINMDVKTIIDAGTKPSSKTAENYVSMRDSFISDGTIYYSYYEIMNNEEIGTVWNIDKEGKIFLEFFDTGEVPLPNSSVSELNASSIAFALNYLNNKWFFAGDLPDFCEKDLVTNIKKTNELYFKNEDNVVYKSCHHGSKTSNGDELLSFIKPDIIFTMSGIISKNLTTVPIVDQHPYLEALERMKKYTNKIYWSSINGLTIFSSEGNEVTITSRGRTVDYYYNGQIVSREDEKSITIFESKWYKALTE